jgi:DNA-binding MurR/RpiR family transcriptional regulator
MRNLFSQHPNVRGGSTVEKLQSLVPTLSPTEARIALYIVRNIDEIGFETGVTLARKAAVSEISVSRFLRKAGYKSISGLKRELQVEAARHHLPDVGLAPAPAEDTVYREVQVQEMKALERVFEEIRSDSWHALVRTAVESSEVFVSGFQSVRGTAEDFARRMGLARNNVRYLSAHDGMLGEWLVFQGDPRPKSVALILIDVVPYANEGLKIAEIAKEMGLKVIVVSDEFCEWAHNVADHTIFAKSRSGLFLESTVALVMILNILVDAVARFEPGSGQSRYDRWQMLTRRIGIF